MTATKSNAMAWESRALSAESRVSNLEDELRCRSEWLASDLEAARVNLSNVSAQWREMRAAIDAVLAVHERVTIPGNLGVLERPAWCRPCGVSWPCDTARAAGAQ